MGWIKGNAKETLEIKASVEKIYAFFSTPALRAQAFDDIEKREVIDAQTERWILHVKKDMGITFRPDYTTRYTGNGKDLITWKTVGEGTTRSTGTARLTAIGPEVTRVFYEESIESNLPIPSIMGRVFRPVVSREVGKGVRDFLAGARRILER